MSEHELPPDPDLDDLPDEIAEQTDWAGERVVAGAPPPGTLGAPALLARAQGADRPNSLSANWARRRCHVQTAASSDGLPRSET